MSTESTPTLTGQTVLVIGGSSGIGYGVALAALNSLASNVIIASSSSQKLNNAVSRLQSHASSNSLEATIKGIIINANDLSSVDKGVKEAGTINHLIFTAGGAELGSLGSLNVKDSDVQKLKDAGVFDVRFWAAIQAIRSATFAPGGSAVITTGSLHKSPMAGLGIATGMAAASAHVVKGLATDMAPSVRVNAVSPGLIDTELFTRVPKEMKDNMFQQGEARVLLKKVGKPADTAEAYLFLMKCSFITGQILEVDGGVL